MDTRRGFVTKGLAALGLISTPGAAFAGACVDENADARHYDREALGLARSIKANGRVGNELDGLSSKNISNVLHQLNNLFLAELRIDGSEVQNDANGDLQDIQRTLRNRREVSQGQIRRFPNKYEPLVRDLIANGNIQNYSLALGAITKQFIADVKDSESERGNNGNVNILTQWDNLTDQIIEKAEKACEIERPENDETPNPTSQERIQKAEGPRAGTRLG